MRSIIVGAGKVGYNIAATLCREGHKVTVIDINRHRLDNLEEYFDINTIEGNGASLNVLEEASVRNIDLLVAVTDSDEVNMLTCYMGKSQGARRTVARVRAPEYSSLRNQEHMQALGADMLINPERVTAAEISKLINFPEAHYVGYYGDGRVLILELPLPDTLTQDGKTLMEIDFPAPCVIIGVERNDVLTIPRGNATLQKGDIILLLARTQDMPEIEQFLGIPHSTIKDVVIMGGDLSSFYLAQILEKRGRRYDIRLIEQDMELCQEMAEDLNHTELINSNSFNLQLFEDENIAECDVFIAMAEDDRENLFACVLAKSLGTKKTIAQIRNGDFINIVEKAGIDKAISPRNLTSDAILRFLSRNKILSFTRFAESNAQIMEFLLPIGAPACDKRIMDLHFPHEAIICMVIRGKEYIIPAGSDQLRAGDRLIIFAMPHALHDVEKLCQGKERK